MAESDTILDTESSEEVKNLRTAGAEDLEQAEMPIEDGFQEKGAGGVPPKNLPLPCQLIRVIQNFLTKGDVSG